MAQDILLFAASSNNSKLTVHVHGVLKPATYTVGTALILDVMCAAHE